MTTLSLAKNEYTCLVATHKTKEHPARCLCVENEGWEAWGYGSLGFSQLLGRGGYDPSQRPWKGM